MEKSRSVKKRSRLCLTLWITSRSETRTTETNSCRVQRVQISSASRSWRTNAELPVRLCSESAEIFNSSSLTSKQLQESWTRLEQRRTSLTPTIMKSKLTGKELNKRRRMLLRNSKELSSPKNLNSTMSVPSRVLSLINPQKTLWFSPRQKTKRMLSC